MKQKEHPIHMWLSGATGRMGTEILQLLQRHDRFKLIGCSGENYWGKLVDNLLVTCSYDEIAPLFHEAELYIDFSSPTGNAALLATISATGVSHKAVLIATTGLTTEQKDHWHRIAIERHLTILFASNTSYGVILVTQTCLQLAHQLHGLGFDIEIHETHHKGKLDSPSGTAKYIASRLADQEKMRPTFCRTGARSPDEIGVTSMRGGSVFGEHTIRFLGENEEITITHRALSRTLFAQGALILGQWLANQPRGVLELEDVHLTS